MVDRVDSGNNTTRLTIYATDTVAQAIAVLNAFLSFRGWSSVSNSRLNASTLKYVYHANTLRPGVRKRMVLYFYTVSGVTKIAVGVATEQGEQSGATDAIMNGMTGRYQGMLKNFHSTASNTVLVVNASQHWCMFSNAGSHAHTCASGTLLHYAYNYNNHQSNYTIFIPNEPKRIDGFQFGLDAYASPVYSGLVPRKYCWKKLNRVPYYTYPYAPRNTTITTKTGYIGVMELKDSVLPYPFIYVDTCDLFNQVDTEDIDLIQLKVASGAILQNLTCLDYTARVVDGIRARPCNLISDALDYIKPAFGSNFSDPWSGKKFFHEIAMEARGYGYIGKMIGLHVTQSNPVAADTYRFDTNEMFEVGKGSYRTEFNRIAGQMVGNANGPRCQFYFLAGRKVDLGVEYRYSSMTPNGTVQGVWTWHGSGGGWDGSYDMLDQNFSNTIQASFIIPA